MTKKIRREPTNEIKRSGILSISRCKKDTDCNKFNYAFLSMATTYTS